MRSSFPSSPGSNSRTYDIRNSSPVPSRTRKSLPNVPNTTPTTAAAGSSSTPLIPVTLIDAPSQRFYVISVYGILLIWCLYDWWKLLEEDAQSIGLFMKWTCIYALCSYGVPQLRIPWLEWSYAMSHASFLIHAGLTFMLMFRIPVRKYTCITRELC